MVSRQPINLGLSSLNLFASVLKGIRYRRGNLKAKCDLELQEWNGRPVQIITQVVLEKTFRKMQNIQRPQDITATAKNVAYKINVKLGGVTTAALSSEEHPHWPTFKNPQEPTLFIGVYVAYCKIEGEVSWFAVTGSITSSNQQPSSHLEAT
ncbi:hypothetical protein L596_000678 [Steinernema carpocapsae]|uniref:Piwi domain-containing protein n=1 Tax=Steinernema carpocapsae TaxID=34508 RepID=A0A4U8UJ54_STECR|nr:hypothetical protein L596_000678 [Steinernema carpocapsae]